MDIIYTEFKLQVNYVRHSYEYPGQIWTLI